VTHRLMVAIAPISLSARASDRRTKVFAAELRISGKWGSNQSACRLR
jgi:hypothetical protein